MIIPADERQEMREQLADTGLAAALSELCDGNVEIAKQVLERTILTIGFLNQGDDIPDWVVNSQDILKEGRWAICVVGPR